MEVYTFDETGLSDDDEVILMRAALLRMELGGLDAAAGLTACFRTRESALEFVAEILRRATPHIRVNRLPVNRCSLLSRLAVNARILQDGVMPPLYSSGSPEKVIRQAERVAIANGSLAGIDDVAWLCWRFSQHFGYELPGCTCWSDVIKLMHVCEEQTEPGAQPDPRSLIAGKLSPRSDNQRQPVNVIPLAA